MVAHLSQGTVTLLFGFFQFFVGFLNSFVHQCADLLDLVDRQRFKFLIGQAHFLHLGLQLFGQDILTNWFLLLQKELGSGHEYKCECEFQQFKSSHADGTTRVCNGAEDGRAQYDHASDC